MQKVFLVLFAVLACTLGCSSLGASPGFDADGGVAEGGGDDATAPGPSNDGATGPSQDGTTSDAGSHIEDAGAYDSGPVGPLDSGSPPPFDSAPPPTCSEVDASWVPDAGIGTAGWTATATATATTDTNRGDFVVANAFDGDPLTRWSSGAAQAGEEGFRLDLGQVQTISQVVFFDETDYPAEYTLALSSDDLTYTQVATGPGAETTAICFPAQSARYVKITQTGVSSSWFSIYEIDVFPPESTTSDAGSQLDDAAAGDSGPPDSGPDAAAPGDAGP
jgi:hypothetical protein